MEFRAGSSRARASTRRTCTSARTWRFGAVGMTRSGIAGATPAAGGCSASEGAARRRLRLAADPKRRARRNQRCASAGGSPRSWNSAQASPRTCRPLIRRGTGRRRSSATTSSATASSGRRGAAASGPQSPPRLTGRPWSSRRARTWPQCGRPTGASHCCTTLTSTMARRRKPRPSAPSSTWPKPTRPSVVTLQRSRLLLLPQKGHLRGVGGSSSWTELPRWHVCVRRDIVMMMTTLHTW
mmetsp:Transcript_65783/g.182298  ORF Transcript_65783/g.182298 Transcript_65783/m.182298 type:complete len:240 (+) Transcript_65783:93-812(+)